MYKLKANGFEYIPPICPRCGSHDIKAVSKNSELECRRCRYNSYWTDFYIGPEREKVQKRFLEQILAGEAPTGLKNK